ncbi:hypothetical protein GCM10009628_03440 [Paeniglutamicibacter kerguelensis]
MVDLIVSSDVQRRSITPLSRMIPGFSIDDARLVRDEVIRRRMSKGDRGAVLLNAHDGLDPVILGERMLSSTNARIPVGSIPLRVRGVLGFRSEPAPSLQAPQGKGAMATPDKLQLGLEVSWCPFGTSQTEDADRIAVNGGVIRLVSAGTHLSVLAGAEFRMLRDGKPLALGRLPAMDEIQRAVAELTDEAGTTWAQHLGERAASRPEPVTVYAIGLGEPISLLANSAIELEVAGSSLATVIADTDHFM